MAEPYPSELPPNTWSSGTYYFLDEFLDRQAIAGLGVIAGLAVSEEATPSMDVAIAAGTFQEAPPGTHPPVEFAGDTITIAASDSERYRVDIVSIGTESGSPVLHVTPGLAHHSAPFPVDRPPINGDLNYDVVLALIVVPPGATTIINTYIYDRRFLLPFTYTGPTARIATAGSTTLDMITYFDADGDLQASDRDVNAVGDVLASVGSAVDGEPVVFAGTTAKSIRTTTVDEILAFLGRRRVRLGSDATVAASTSLAEITGLQFTATGTGSFAVVYWLRWRTDTTTTGIAYSMNHTGTATVVGTSLVTGAAGAANQASTVAALSGASWRAFSSSTPKIVAISADTANADMLAVLIAHVEVTAGGDLELYHACSVAAGTVITRAGSGALLFKLG